MANWKKVLVSGSDIEINEIQATGGITASGIDPSNTGGGSDHVLVINSDGHVLKRAQSDVQGVTTAIFTLTGSAGDNTASFDATGDALHLSSSNGDFTITVDSSSVANVTSLDFNFTNNVVSGAAQIANEISGAFGAISGNLYTTSQSLETLSTAYTGISASYALSESILGTANEIKVTGTGENDITIGLPQNVHVSGALTVTSSLVVSQSITADTLTLTGLSLIDNNAAIISGSNVFGSDNGDVHAFTGSVSISGSISSSTLPTINDRVVKDLLAVSVDGGFVRVGTNIHAAISGAFNEASSSITSSIGALALAAESSGSLLNVVSGNLYTTSQSLEVVSGNLYTTSQSLEVVSGNLYTTSQSISTISGNLYTTSQSLGAISGNLYSTSQSLETLSSSVFSVSAIATANSSALQNLGSITGDVTGTHVSMSVLGIQGVAISANEATQIAEIGDTTTISSQQWGYLAALNQSLTTDSNVEFDNLTVENLTVTSTTTNINTTNLNVSDRFILLNSHSLAAEDSNWSPADGGIVVQLSGSYAGAKVGTALYYDNTEERWALVGSASNASGDASGLNPDQFIVSVKTEAGSPGSNPVDFGNDNDSWYGMMHIDTNDTDGDGNNIYIYA